MNKNLFDDSDDNIEEHNFHIKTNENYASSYNTLRKKELLQKYKDKGLDVSESDSNDSDSSEEDEVLDPSFDQHFLKTLASLKSKDPAIYDKSTKFFKNVETDDDSDGEDEKSNTNKEKKSKPVTLKDYERKIILEKGGKFVDDSDEDDVEDQSFQRPLSPSLVEEERRLKAEFKNVMNQDDDSGDEEFGGIFKKREKTKAEKDREEEDYLKWLAGKKENIEEDVKEKLEPLKKYWNNDKLPSSEKFLRDYVLNKGYTEANNYDEIPTYEEIVGDAPLSEDEEELEKQAEFEQKYNFRYEEPDQEFIKRYPRTIESSLRLTDEKRKLKRQETKERKLQEKEQKMKELEMVKEMKRKEIQEKIEKLKMVTGNDELGFKDDDLDEDFDPEAHDRRMQELFNDDYYEVDEGEEKPECPSDIDELKVEDWDNYDPNDDGGAYDYDDNDRHCEDEDFNMDCEYDATKAKEELQKELIENTKKRRGGRKGRRDRFMEIIKADKPVFDPEDEQTYGDYIDEYYQLDCEDIIGDTPCRFKYVETAPNDFGLTIEEILLAKNKELNQWASLKKAIQIRPDQVEKKEQRLYKLKAKNEDLKRKIFKSLYGDGSDDENEETEKDQTNEQNSTNPDTSATTENTTANIVPGESKKAKKRRKRKAQNAQAGTDNSAAEEKQTNDSNNAENKETGEATAAKKAKIDQVATTDGSANSKMTTDTQTDLGKTNKQKNHSQNVTANKGNKFSNNDNKNPFNKGVSHKQTKNTGNKMFNKNNHAQQTNNSPGGSKTASNNNPFAKGSTEDGVGSLPPLRKNIAKTKNVKGNFKSKDNKFKSKFQGKKPFNGKQTSKGDGKDISDDRLKAYGINPRKFHKQQKYGNKS
ncbi:protein KRI1 homolog [Calliphora vicina]|uniref:protein KRI1 homolog n=1 Tax=Calliphora vicina TaxID=7373 RepID=UPI00325C07C3